MHLMHQFYKVSGDNSKNSVSSSAKLIHAKFCSTSLSLWLSKRYRIGGAKRDRTADPLRARQVLSQLSYSPSVLFSPKPIVHVYPSVRWWAWVDSNHRPHPYQGCALTNWATGPRLILRLIKIICCGHSWRRYYVFVRRWSSPRFP